jgi:benzodiazapine receptor
LWIAAVIIVALDVLVLLTLISFWPVSRLAAALFVPYLAWVLYATTLNIGIAVLNA